MISPKHCGLLYSPSTSKLLQYLWVLCALTSVECTLTSYVLCNPSSCILSYLTALHGQWYCCMQIHAGGYCTLVLCCTFFQGIICSARSTVPSKQNEIESTTGIPWVFYHHSCVCYCLSSKVATCLPAFSHVLRGSCALWPSIGGSVEEFSPATREARVRFPDVASLFSIRQSLFTRQ